MKSGQFIDEVFNLFVKNEFKKRVDFKEPVVKTCGNKKFGYCFVSIAEIKEKMYILSRGQEAESGLEDVFLTDYIQRLWGLRDIVRLTENTDFDYSIVRQIDESRIEFSSRMSVDLFKHIDMSSYVDEKVIEKAEKIIRRNPPYAFSLALENFDSSLADKVHKTAIKKIRSLVSSL